MGPKWIKVKVDAETGEWKVKDDTPNGPEDVDASVIPKDAREIGVILHSHSSPGCVYFRVGNRAYKRCT
jgi:hypothetical protein